MKTRAIVSIMFNLLMVGFIMSLSVYSYSDSYSKVQNQQVELAQNAPSSMNLASVIEHNAMYLSAQNYLQHEFV
ncbi:MAG: hypothetical protein K0Q57_1096 [Gammaproteobacteria bacterium]|jgi:hypothetical protein|nr:hypothetical protein [Gammaproteobacteria bacterium]